MKSQVRRKLIMTKLYERIKTINHNDRTFGSTKCYFCDSKVLGVIEFKINIEGFEVLQVCPKCLKHIANIRPLDLISLNEVWYLNTMEEVEREKEAFFRRKNDQINHNGQGNRVQRFNFKRENKTNGHKFKREDS